MLNSPLALLFLLLIVVEALRAHFRFCLFAGLFCLAKHMPLSINFEVHHASSFQDALQATSHLTRSLQSDWATAGVTTFGTSLASIF